MESLGSRAKDSVDIDEAMKTGMKFIETCGVIEKCNEASYFVSNANSRGAGVYGPYINLGAGQYIVKFDLELYEYKEHYSDQVCAEFDVTMDSGNVRLAHTRIYESRLKASPSSELFFKLDQPSVVEFRIHFTGRSRLRVSMSPSLRQVDPAKPCYVPMLPESTDITSPFFVNNSGHLRGMFENGASFSLDGENTIVSFGDVTFQMHTLEDFQVVNEVFIFNDYRYITNNRTICVDIGMNSGLTSLFFANLPNVVEVHSFEPFSTPFKRAQTNFSYNPQLAKKIVANRFGLGDGARRLEVLIDETQTIGTSISGLSAGVPQEIEIRDAGEVVEKILERARELGCEVMLKVDCEGSEFPIFDSLERSGLLKSIRAMAIEWHRTWEHDKNQDLLLDPLMRNGFVVFDRTQASDLFAGQFWAVRTNV